MPTNTDWSEQHRAVMAQRLSRLLLASDDDGLERFRRQQLRDAPHVTLEELRVARTILEHLADQLCASSADGWLAVIRALDLLKPPAVEEPREEPGEEPLDGGKTLVRPARLDRPAPSSQPPRSGAPAFVRGMSPAGLSAPAPRQASTATISHDLRVQFRTLDEVMQWSVDDWAKLCADLEARPYDTEAVWAERGITGGRSTYESIEAAWATRLREAETKRKFDASLARHRFMRMIPPQRTGNRGS